MSARRPKAVVAGGSGGAAGLERRSPRRPKAVVAMSGGVDSSVAAALLVRAGYEVTGVMLKLWRGEPANLDSGCCNLGAADDARRVADTLGIAFYVLNVAEDFTATVVRNFHEDYAAGRTPNPCVRCNHWIKFDVLLERALALGADVLATGHYARVRSDAGRARLLRGVDRTKDQSYVLWMLTQRQLAQCRFPVGGMTKAETRRLAAQLGLRTAAKPDSQEICFVRGGDLGAYMDEHMAAEPGPIVDTSGRNLGRHRGLGRYTVGQRKGLGISLGVPVYVTHVDAASNALVVGDRDELLVSGLRTEETSFVDEALAPGAPVLVQHRAHGDVSPARVASLRERRLELVFADPVESVAPGQSAAFYAPSEPDRLLGGGYISSTVPARAVA
jgi:tRNA-specific 2-thiouridylase